MYISHRYAQQIRHRTDTSVSTARRLACATSTNRAATLNVGTAWLETSKSGLELVEEPSFMGHSPWFYGKIWRFSSETHELSTGLFSIAILTYSEVSIPQNMALYNTVPP